MIFDWSDFVAMVNSVNDLASLQYRAQGELTNLLINISTLDDPYYMDLPRETYGMLVESGQNRAI